jgi:putative transposase
MPRIARVIVPGVPHHVTQRGNRRQQTFFCDGDYRLYCDLMAQWCGERGVEIWAYCLMPNHVHLIAVPEEEDGLRRAIGDAHRRYTRYVNFREGWRGHLWQGRFASFPLDDAYLLVAARYIELNPVRAGLASAPEEYPWSSAAAHLTHRHDELVRTEPLLARCHDWYDYLTQQFPAEQWDALRKHERTGRPLGSDAFVSDLERSTGRCLRPQRRGRKPKETKPCPDARKPARQARSK